MKSIFTFPVLIIFLVQIGVAQQKVEKSFEGISSIRLNTASGDCSFRKGNSSAVSVLVEFTYDADEFEVKMEKSGARLILEEKFKERNVSGSSDWTLIVPDGLDIDFNSGSGKLEMNGLAADIKFNTGSGDARITDAEGEFDFNSGSGDFTFEKITGEIEANSGSGDHRINEVDAEVRANTGSGDVELESSSGSFGLNTGSGDVEAEKISLKANGEFNSGSGDVEIVLQASLDHDIHVNSGSGDAILDFNGNKIEGNIIMKAKKRGGEIRAPFEFDKVEEVEDHGETYIKKTKKFGNRNIEIYVGTGTGNAVIRE